jgi:hypothetical protein
MSQQQQQPQGRRDIEARIIANAWKDEAYKQELLTNSKVVIEREFDAQLPEEVNVQVLEENPTSLYFVLPMRPDVPGHELNEEELEAVAGGKISPEMTRVLPSTVAYSASLLTLAGGWTIGKDL